jgi:tRNA threonylcarbamoyladenosine biosynthesis protein TsaE
MSKVMTHSIEETHALAAEFAKELTGGELVALVGDLGSGKTTFVRGVVEALGSKVRVKSPTFTVMNEYPIDSKNISKIVHVDLYRFKDPKHLEGIALDDVIKEGTVVFVEWPDIFGKLFAKPDREVRFTFVDESTRGIEII